MHVESGVRGGRGGRRDWNAWGAFFPPNEKQVTVHCKAISLVGIGERKKREEGKVENPPQKPLFFLVFSCELLPVALVL